MGFQTLGMVLVAKPDEKGCQTLGMVLVAKPDELWALLKAN